MVEAGEEVVITRRGEKVAKLTGLREEGSGDRFVDWAESVRRRNERLRSVPQLQRNIIVELREEERS
jgi:antitoxin (DNA-binding transcriptional repressor) of toxin-antitoxin stability system